MTILITGGAGYIGSHIVHEFAEARERPVVLDDLSTGFARSIPKDVPLIVGDCGNADFLATIMSEHKVTAIFHLAASTVLSESIEYPLRYYRNNTANTLMLIEAAIKSGVSHFILSSTAAVYGRPTQMPVTEDSPTQPVSPYGQSKLMSELMLGDAARAHGLGYVILRYFNVAGADPRMRTGQSTSAATNLIKVAVQAALGRRQKMEIYGTDYPTADGTCIRDYIHVTDLAQAHIAALEYLRKGGSSVTLNCGYGRGASVREVIESVKRIAGADFPVEHAPRRAGDLPEVVASSERARATLGWRPRLDDLDLMVGHALAWEKALTGNRA